MRLKLSFVLPGICLFLFSHAVRAEALSPTSASASVSPSAGFKLKTVNVSLNGPLKALGPARHQGLGVLRAFQDDGKVLLIKHKAFADGFMGPMEMPFELSDSKLAQGLKVGDRIKFTLEAHEDDFWVVSITKSAK